MITGITKLSSSEPLVLSEGRRRRRHMEEPSLKPLEQSQPLMLMFGFH